MSLLENGQRFPVLITDSGEVLSGERRRAACVLTGCPVRVCVAEDLDDAVTMIGAEQHDRELAVPLTVAEAIWRDMALRELRGSSQTRNRRPALSGICQLNETQYTRAREIVRAADGLEVSAGSGQAVRDAAAEALRDLETADGSVIYKTFMAYRAACAPEPSRGVSAAGKGVQRAVATLAGLADGLAGTRAPAGLSPAEAAAIESDVTRAIRDLSKFRRNLKRGES